MNEFEIIELINERLCEIAEDKTSSLEEVRNEIKQISECIREWQNGALI